MRFPDVLLLTAVVWLLLAIGGQVWTVIHSVDAIRAGGVGAILATALTFAQSVLFGFLAVAGAFAVRLLERIEKKLTAMQK